MVISSLHKNDNLKMLCSSAFQGLNPGRAIAEIKKLLAGIAKKGDPGMEGTAGVTTAKA